MAKALINYGAPTLRFRKLIDGVVGDAGWPSEEVRNNFTREGQRLVSSGLDLAEMVAQLEVEWQKRVEKAGLDAWIAANNPRATPVAPVAAPAEREPEPPEVVEEDHAERLAGVTRTAQWVEDGGEADDDDAPEAAPAAETVMTAPAEAGLGANQPLKTVRPVEERGLALQSWRRMELVLEANRLGLADANKMSSKIELVNWIQQHRELNEEK